MEYIRTPKVENVRLLSNHSRNSTAGTLYLTATHLIFVDANRENEMWLVHTHIQNLEKLSITQDGAPLRIRCKTFQVLVFLIAQERDCHDLYSSLLKLSKPVKMDELYAFSYNPREDQLQSDGWDLFSLNNDYLQMGLPTRFWKISRINNEFGLCETYPKLICVPSLATPALMMGSASFRSKRRLPVLSYLHKNGSVIVRCSQPMAGINSRSIEDEAFVKMIRCSKANSNDFMYIVDTRPMINAYANRAQGKGYENTDWYENIKYLFLGIDNIHVMRNSLNKLLEACEDSRCSMNSWLEAVGNSGWLKHVHSVIQVSRFIAKAVGVENRSVLVHCSDGWDRTAQTCALASIMLNPHYRTVDGFLALVQKEWLHFGHKFEHRSGHLDGDSREVSPVFSQFIDAVWQLMRLRPSSFQFNEQLLFDLNDHVFSCQFGTFLGNCPKVRQEHSLATRTYSLWGWMMKRLDLYMNPLYRAVEQLKPQNEILLPPTTPHYVKFWVGMYNRFDKGLQPRESLLAAVKELRNKAFDLSKTVADVRKQRDKLREKLGLPEAGSPKYSEVDLPAKNESCTNASLKRLTISSEISLPSLHRPASTNDIVADRERRVRSMAITSATTHSNPDISSVTKPNQISKSLVDASLDPSTLAVSFTTGYAESDSECDVVSPGNGDTTQGAKDEKSTPDVIRELTQAEKSPVQCDVISPSNGDLSQPADESRGDILIESQSN